MSSVRAQEQRRRILTLSTTEAPQTEDEKLIRERSLQARREWIENHLFIRNKQKQIILLKFNPLQVRLFEEINAPKGKRSGLLKFRQFGGTTLVLADFFEETIHVPNTQTLVMAHDAESTMKLFRIVQLFYKNLPDEVKIRLNGRDKQGRPRKPRVGNKKEFFFEEINSSISVATAGNENTGRSATPTNVLLTEIAFYPDPETLLTGLLQSVPMDGRIVAESTANGFNYFHDLYEDGKTGKSRWNSIFFRWFEHPEYRIPLAPGTVFELSPKEKELVRLHGLSLEQIGWRRMKIAEMPHKPGATKEELFLQEYPEDDLSCFLSSGRPVFDRPLILTVKSRIEKDGPFPVEYALDAGAKVWSAIYPMELGELKVWKHPDPGLYYVIGADTSEGLADGCDATASVLEYWSGEQVAEYRGKADPDLFGKKLARLGYFYNRAGIAVERNNHGHAVLSTLLNYERYPNLYHHLEYDAERGEESKRPGFPTTPTTKPILLSDMVAEFREGRIKVNSLELLDQMFSYMLNEKGLAVPAPGKFSDLIIAMAIAIQARKVMRPGGGARMVNVS